MSEKVDTGDLKIAELAARQHGVVSIHQLCAAGIDHDGVRYRVGVGRLHRIHRGVYAVGHPGLPLHGRWMAAALACGEGAAVSHRSAAELWSLLEVREGPVHISVPSSSGRIRRRDAMLVHRRPTLRRDAVTRRYGIPVTKPAQTIADLKGSVPPKELRRAIRQANVLGLPIGSETGRDRTRSDLERDFLRLCRRFHLPAPEVNVRVGTCLVDFLWRDRRLVVETDGYRFHRGKAAFEDDRARDLDLRGLGYEVRHFTYRQVHDEPSRVATDLREALGLAS